MGVLYATPTVASGSGDCGDVTGALTKNVPVAWDGPWMTVICTVWVDATGVR